MTLHLTHIEPAAPDLGILCVANDIAQLIHGRSDIPADVSRHLADITRRLMDRSGEVRAVMQACPAANLIEIVRACGTKGDLLAAVADHRTALRCLPTAAAVRVLIEGAIAYALRSVGGRG